MCTEHTIEISTPKKKDAELFARIAVVGTKFHMEEFMFFLYDSQFFIRVWMTCVRVSEIYYARTHVTGENANA